MDYQDDDDGREAGEGVGATNFDVGGGGELEGSRGEDAGNGNVGGGECKCGESAGLCLK